VEQEKAPVIRVTVTLPRETYDKIVKINEKLGISSRVDAENIRNYIIASLPLFIREYIEK